MDMIGFCRTIYRIGYATICRHMTRMDTPIAVCSLLLLFAVEIPMKKKNDCNDAYDWIVWGNLSHRIRNDMSAYDTYRHTHCSVIFTAFICSENSNETRKYV